jgi:hypothetical protein
VISSLQILQPKVVVIVIVVVVVVVVVIIIIIIIIIIPEQGIKRLKDSYTCPSLPSM